MAFHDVRLPDDIERGAQGGPRFKTTVLTLSSGFEQRNIDWQLTRSAWDISYGVDSKVNFTRLIDFFFSRQGRAHSFRFKDWTDFELPRQLIGLTDGSTTDFQVFKRYSSGGLNFDRNLEKIVLDSESVWVDNVQIFEGVGGDQYELDDLTGILTIGTVLASQSSTDIEILCEFDVPVRFDTDALDINALTFQAGSLPQLDIIEVRGE